MGSDAQRFLLKRGNQQNKPHVTARCEQAPLQRWLIAG